MSLAFQTPENAKWQYSGFRDSSEFNKNIQNAVSHIHKSGMHKDGAKAVLNVLREWFGRRFTDAGVFDQAFECGQWRDGNPKTLEEFPCAESVYDLLIKAKMTRRAAAIKHAAKLNLRQ